MLEVAYDKDYREFFEWDAFDLEIELKQKREEYEAQLKAFQSAKAPATDPNIIMLKAKLETLRSIYKEAVEIIEKLSEDNRAKPRQ